MRLIDYDGEIEEIFATNMKKRVAFLAGSGWTVAALGRRISIPKPTAHSYLIRARLASLPAVARMLFIPPERAHWLLAVEFDPAGDAAPEAPPRRRTERG